MRFSLRPASVVLLLAVPLIASCPQRHGGQREPAGVRTKSLTDRVLAKDHGAITAAKQAPPSDIPPLARAATHSDPAVRRLALLCLDEVGGPAAEDAFVAALGDEDLGVRAVAMSALHHHPAPRLSPALLAAFDRASDPLVRQQVALVLGRISNSDPTELRRRLDADPDPEAQEGCISALARLGDAPAREAFVARLHAARGRDRARWLGNADYVHAAWLLKPLLPLLDDPEPVVRVGVEELRIGPAYLRVCDLALNLAVDLTGFSFSFQTGPRVNYTAAQIDEVRRFLQQLP